MIKKIALIAGCFTFLLITTSQSGEKNLREHEGVVTLHILPAKLIEAPCSKLQGIFDCKEFCHY